MLFSSNGNLYDSSIDFGYSTNENSILIKFNTTSFSFTQAAVWDWNSGNEISSSVLFENDVLFSFGMKDIEYIYIKKHNLTTFELIDQKIFLPQSTNQQPDLCIFYCYGITGDRLAAYYMSYLDKYSIVIFDK